MRGLMMDQPLLVSQIIAHAARWHADTEIVSQTVEGPTHRYGYEAAERRAKKLARALLRLGIMSGDRIATMGWNTYRHFELYYGISGIGAICHTINPRLFEDQIAYIVNHAEDKLIFVDLSFVPLLERLRERLPNRCRFIVLSDDAHMPACNLPLLCSYESLINGETDDLDWPSLDENSASSLCYSSGTTGNPKGALYSHRSTVLHAMAVSLPDAFGLSARETVCPVVPMFHVNAWGTPYAVPLVGAKLVLPGPRVDGESLHGLFERESVTFSLGVPTVWQGLAAHLDTGIRCTTLRRILSGGSAVPPSMIRNFADRYGVEMLHAWGMTELSPVGAASLLKGKHLTRSSEERTALLRKQGRPFFGVDMKIVGESGAEIAHDGSQAGELLVRGPWTISAYYADEAATAAAMTGGWFRTGDIATLDDDGFMQIMDRRKDVVKSGGEWISSIDLENAVMAHPDIAEAAVIAVPHPRWGERPLMLLTLKPGSAPIGLETIHAFLTPRFPRWMLPADVVLVESLPHTATGKIMKTQLREMFRDHVLPSASP